MIATNSRLHIHILNLATINIDGKRKEKFDGRDTTDAKGVSYQSVFQPYTLLSVLNNIYNFNREVVLHCHHTKYRLSIGHTNINNENKEERNYNSKILFWCLVVIDNLAKIVLKTVR